MIRTSDGVFGSHAITVWNGMIFYSSCCYALRWSQRSLDWCSGSNSTCIGFSKVYRLCPDCYSRKLPGDTVSVGTQVSSHLSDLKTLGWIRLLPTMNTNGEQKSGYIARYVDGSKATLSAVEVAKYKLKK